MPLRTCPLGEVRQTELKNTEKTQNQTKASFHILAYFLQQANGITMFCVSWT